MKNFLFIFIFLLAIRLESTTYYVDYVNGDDNNNGTTEQTPWQHVPIDLNASGNSFSASIQPGDTILLKGGLIYRGKLLSSSYFGRRNLGDGEPGKPIVLKGDGWGAEKAIIDGSVVLTGWTRCSSAAECGGNANWQNIWYTTLDSEWTQGENRALTLNLYQGEKMLALSQYPNMPNPFYYDNTSYFVEADTMTTTYLVDDLLAQLDDAGMSGVYVALWCGNNSVSVKPITTYNSEKYQISYAEINNPYGYYSILNSLDEDVFDQEGEFCYNESTHTLYVWPLDGVDPNTVEMTISIYSTGIDFWGDNYITIEGFVVQKFIGAGISESSSPVAYGYTIRNNIIRYCRAPNGGHSINLKTTENSLVENNFIYRNAGPIRGFGLLGGSGHITQNNIIQESGKTGIYYSGVSNGMILNNRIIDNKGKHANGISTYQGCQNILVAGNTVINSNIAFTFEHSTDIYVYNNIFIGSKGAYSVACWGGQDGAYIYHNLIGPVLYIPSTTTNVKVKNNIFLIGDAAGFVDPISGKGIPYSILSGEIVAFTIEKYFDENNQHLISTAYIKNLKKTAEFIKKELGSDTPWHVTQFCGKISWKLQHIEDTPVETLKRAYEIGKKAGLKYVYTGNVPGLPTEDTFCPKCGALVIDRTGYIIHRHDKNGKCPKCGQDINLILK